MPRRLKRAFPAHDVRTVPEMGWSGKKNGELLALAVGQSFEVLLTVDRSLRRQQNLRAAGLGVLVLVAPSNRLSDLIRLVPLAEAALPSLNPGDVAEVVAP